MVDLISSITSAIAIAKRLKDVADKIKDAEVKNLVADLSFELADIKSRMADVTNENTRLKEDIRKLGEVEGEKCPKCAKRTWLVESSRPNPTFGRLGGIDRKYKCSACGYFETTLVTPGKT